MNELLISIGDILQSIRLRLAICDRLYKIWDVEVIRAQLTAQAECDLDNNTNIQEAIGDLWFNLLQIVMEAHEGRIAVEKCKVYSKFHSCVQRRVVECSSNMFEESLGEPQLKKRFEKNAKIEEKSTAGENKSVVTGTTESESQCTLYAKLFNKTEMYTDVDQVIRQMQNCNFGKDELRIRVGECLQVVRVLLDDCQRICDKRLSTKAESSKSSTQSGSKTAHNKKSIRTAIDEISLNLEQIAIKADEGRITLNEIQDPSMQSHIISADHNAENEVAEQRKIDDIPLMDLDSLIIAGGAQIMPHSNVTDAVPKKETETTTSKTALRLLFQHLCSRIRATTSRLFGMHLKSKVTTP